MRQKQEAARVAESLATTTNEKNKLSEELQKRKETTGEENLKPEAYQAIFFKSGKVYYGKVTKLTENQITLTDIYYLRTQTSGGANDVSLVKLGAELHGPEDVMYIERKEVEFWENLKDDGDVVKAIKEYQLQNPGR